jgi:hypothetical protein
MTAEDARNDHLFDVTRSNLERLSRTVSTLQVNTDTAPAKMNRLVSRTADASKIARSVREALGFLRNRSPRLISPNDLLQTNSLLVAPFYRRGEWRTHESSEFGYLSATDIASDVQSLCEFMRNASSSDNLSMARAILRIHVGVNLHGHYFADGCCRTAVVLSSWFSDRITGRPWELPARDQYLRFASSHSEAQVLNELLEQNAPQDRSEA